jgi:hypothetical protein
MEGKIFNVGTAPIGWLAYFLVGRYFFSIEATMT